MARTYYTILIYLRDGKAQTFRAYEAQALPYLTDYGGRVEAAFRPEVIGSDFPPPDEVHVLSFDTPDGFDRYRRDSRVTAVVSLRDESVARAILLKGVGFDPTC